MTNHSLVTRLIANPETLVPTDISYWLTIEQIVEDDRATAADVAKLVDELYDIDPCIDTDTEGTEPAAEEPAAESEEGPAEEDLVAAAAAVFDLEECKRRMSGTYLAELKIVRSHPDIPYTLRLSVGLVKKTVIVSANISANLSVQSAASLLLTSPIESGLSAAWLGTVYSAAGAIAPPVIQASGNTLFWGVAVTGTIRVEYATTYDLVTVEIPGVPNYVGSPLGEPQDSNVLAFYHYQVYQGSISPPPTDSSADEATLAEICGWTDESGLDQPEEPPPLPEPPPMPEYGCIEESLMFGDPNYYAEKCCEAATPNPCAVRKEANPGGKTLPQDEIDRLTREHTGPIEFIAVGPDGIEGCGALYTRQVLKPKNCCDEAEPLEWDADSSVEILAPGSSGIVFVNGGIGPYAWSVRGIGFTLDGYSMRDGVTDHPYALIYASSAACGTANISVSDGCSEVVGNVKSTIGSWNTECRVLRCDISISSLVDRYRLTDICDPPVSIAAGSDLILSPPPGGNHRVLSYIAHYAGGSWILDGSYCVIADLSIMEKTSFNAALAAISSNVKIVEGVQIGPPSGDEYRDADNFRCRWIC